MDSKRGSLSESSLIEILKNGAASNLTGMIRLENGPIIKVIYFQNGTIAFASSNEKADRLTEVLKRAGKLTPEQVEDAQARLKPNISLGKTLVELGYISARDLLWGARAQVEGILYQLLFWTEGIYQLMEGGLPKEIIVLNLSVPGVIFDGICKSNDREWVLQQIGSPEAVYKLVSDFHEKYIPHKLRMLRADDIVSRMDGKRTIEQIAHLVGIDTFEACKITAALQLLSLAEKIPEIVEAEPLEPEPFELPEMEHETAEPLKEEFPEPTLAVVGKGEQLLLEPSAVSLGQMIQLPTVEEREETATNTVEEQAVPPEGQLLLDEAGLEPVLLAEPEAPSESVMVTTAREENPKTSPSSWMIALLVLVAMAASGYYYYTTRESVPVTPLQVHNRMTRPAGKKAPLSNPVPIPPGPQPVTPQPAEIKPALPANSSKPQTNAAASVIAPAPQIPPPNSAPVVAPAPQIPPPEKQTFEPPPPQAKSTGESLALVQKGKLSEAAAQWQHSLAAEKAKFAVQLAIACQPDTVTDAVARFTDKSKFYILPMQFRGQPCYRVMVGNFDDQATAEAARQTLPAEFLQQPSPPQVVPVIRLLKQP